MSPTQRTLKKLRSEGYTCGIVEKWNPFAKVRQDLFGFIDIIAINGGSIIAIQACNKSDVYKRRKKILAEGRAKTWIQSGSQIIIHGWDKKELKEIQVFLSDFSDKQ